MRLYTYFSFFFCACVCAHVCISMQSQLCAVMSIQCPTRNSSVGILLASVFDNKLYIYILFRILRSSALTQKRRYQSMCLAQLLGIAEEQFSLRHFRFFVCLKRTAYLPYISVLCVCASQKVMPAQNQAHLCPHCRSVHQQSADEDLAQSFLFFLLSWCQSNVILTPPRQMLIAKREQLPSEFWPPVTGGTLNLFPTPLTESSIFCARFERGKAASHLFEWPLRLGGLKTECERKTTVEFLCAHLPQISVPSFLTESVCSTLADYQLWETLQIPHFLSRMFDHPAKMRCFQRLNAVASHSGFNGKVYLQRALQTSCDKSVVAAECFLIDCTFRFNMPPCSLEPSQAVCPFTYLQAMSQ